MPVRILLSLWLLLSAAPALAGEGAQVPEGSQLTLFALGILGVIVGRRASMRRPGKDPDQD
jgi:hypothetical protein